MINSMGLQNSGLCCIPKIYYFTSIFLKNFRTSFYLMLDRSNQAYIKSHEWREECLIMNGNRMNDFGNKKSAVPQVKYHNKNANTLCEKRFHVNY